MERVMLLFVCCFSCFLSAKSATDSIPVYIRNVTEAINKDSVFIKFRSLQGIRSVYEHVNTAQGINFYYKIKSSFPYLFEYAEEFSINEKIGSPFVCYYKKLGRMAPTTLRYIYFLGEMLDLFALKDGCKIVEVGCGYGGQCSILSRVVNFGSYRLIDLDFVCPLIEKYLKAVNVENFETEDASRISSADERDLFISNYGISECWKEAQDEYIEKVIRFCKRGYILYNRSPGGTSYSPEEFCDRLREYGLQPVIVRETVNTCNENRLIYWGADNPKS